MSLVTFGEHDSRISDLSDDDVIVTSGEILERSESKVGLFDVVKRDFRCETAKIIGNRSIQQKANDKTKKNERNFIKEMKARVAAALEMKNKGIESLQNKDYRTSIKAFHQALLYIKGIDPDEDVVWNKEYEDVSAEEFPLRTMPSKLKKIKENIEVDCYIYLTDCLHQKDSPPYKKLKDYCLRVIKIKPDHVKALKRIGVACYHLREYDMSLLYLKKTYEQNSTDSFENKQIRELIVKVEEKMTQSKRRSKKNF